MHEICEASLRLIENNNQELEPLGSITDASSQSPPLHTRSASPQLTEWLSHSSLMCDALSETGFCKQKGRENNQMHCRTCQALLSQTQCGVLLL